MYGNPRIFTSANPKNAFRNMIAHGLKQSDRIIIDNPGLTQRFMERSISNRVSNRQDIKEVWLRNEDGTISLLYKKNGRLTSLSAPAGNESVVISYGIVVANILIIRESQTVLYKKRLRTERAVPKGRGPLREVAFNPHR